MNCDTPTILQGNAEVRNKSKEMPWNVRIAVAMLCAMASLPFLNPIHSMPIPSFYSEWLAALLSIGFLTALFSTRKLKVYAFPEVAWIPVVLILAVLVQLAWGHVSNPGYARIYALYLTLAAVLVVAAATLRQAGYATIAARGMAWALVIGAGMQCAILLSQAMGYQLSTFPLEFLQQYTHLAPSLPTSSARVEGAMGQRNHAASHIWVGIGAITFLATQGGLTLRTACSSIVLMAIASSLTAGRSVYLYPLVLAMVCLITPMAFHAKTVRRALIITLLSAIPAMLAADLLRATWPSSPVQWQSGTSSGILLAGAPGSIRPGLLRAGLAAIADHPFAGSGVGAAPSATFRHAGTWPANETPVVAEHLHQIVAQLALEFGIPIALLVLVLAIRWVIAAHRTKPSKDAAVSFLALLVVGVLGAHSLLEYPLWLAYFCFPLAVLVGLTHETKSAVTNRSLRATVLALICAGGGAICLPVLWRDYRQLEAIAAMGDIDTNAGQNMLAVLSALQLERRDSLLSANAAIGMADLMGVRKESVNETYPICQRALKHSPKPHLVAKCVAISSLAGHDSEARLLWLAGKTAYPSNSGSFMQTWELLKIQNPALGGVSG
jgi:hypothetical protein